MSARNVKAFFERVASGWDTMRLADCDERVIEKMAAVSDAGASLTVTDIGTRTGFVAAGLAPRVGLVLAVDNSPAMLEVARKNLTELGISNVELLECDVSALPLESGSADAAIANMVLYHAGDSARMLREMARVVKPGGAVAILDESSIPSYGCARRTLTPGWGSPRVVSRGVLQRGRARKRRPRVTRDAVMYRIHDLGRG